MNTRGKGKGRKVLNDRIRRLYIKYIYIFDSILKLIERIRKNCAFHVSTDEMTERMFRVERREKGSIDSINSIVDPRAIIEKDPTSKVK